MTTRERTVPGPETTAGGQLRTVLIANRGEIARRIQRTCQALGIATVAVHSPADADAPHVRAADAAVPLPGDAPADSYLRGADLIAAALSAGADAIHPGYGFLAEHAGFARQVTAAGLVWIGPPADAIETMASKTAAKQLMGSQPLDPAALTSGQLPVLVKATAGGGGRGMRIVTRLDELDDQLAAARSEAEAAFSDGTVFVEPYLPHARHVEVQILADAHGTVWTLGTRDCSVQRRHQKVIEEAPAPALPDRTYRHLAKRAEHAARATGYRGAGTVEFLVTADGEAHFLEMNTRLQVEHPVTEEIYGLDLVAWQIHIAEGAALPPEPPPPDGHAVEARLYAEDPARQWLPQTGVLHHLGIGEPSGGPGGGAGQSRLRVECGIADGDTVSPFYDPMLAKVVLWAPTRQEALRRLAAVLERARIHGPATNRELLTAVLRHPDFQAAALDTGFLDRHPDVRGHTAPGTPPIAATGTAAPGPSPTAAQLAALACALADARQRTAVPGAGVAARLGGWRNLPSQPHSAVYLDPRDDTTYRVHYRQTPTGPAPSDAHHPGVAAVRVAPDHVTLAVHGVHRAYRVARYPGTTARFVDAGTRHHTLTPVPRLPAPGARTPTGSLLAPMPGTVSRIADGLRPGVRVRAGTPLLWLSAMKMEHQVDATTDGTLTELRVAAGQQLDAGAVLAVITS